MIFSVVAVFFAEKVESLLGQLPGFGELTPGIGGGDGVSPADNATVDGPLKCDGSLSFGDEGFGFPCAFGSDVASNEPRPNFGVVGRFFPPAGFYDGAPFAGAGDISDKIVDVVCGGVDKY